MNSQNTAQNHDRHHHQQGGRQNIEHQTTKRENSASNITIEMNDKSEGGRNSVSPDGKTQHRTTWGGASKRTADA